MIKTSPEQRNKIKRLLGPPTSHTAEIVWSYLLADVLCTSEARYQYVHMLSGADVPVENVHDVWLEAQPLPPRKGRAGDTEGNTVLDLAFGAVRQRGTTQSGIEFDPNSKIPWVCFAEVKILADISSGVRYDPNRKQLTRIIENLLCFQAAREMSDRLFFDLVTPRAAQQQSEATKLYHQIMTEYQQDKAKIEHDIELSPFPKRNQPDWIYPQSLSERLARLEVKWIAFESIFEKEFGIPQWDMTKQPIPDIVQARLNALSSAL